MSRIFRTAFVCLNMLGPVLVTVFILCSCYLYRQKEYCLFFNFPNFVFQFFLLIFKLNMQSLQYSFWPEVFYFIFSSDYFVHVLYVKYNLIDREKKILQHFQMHLSEKRKIFPEFFLEFSKFWFIFGYFQKNDALLPHVFLNLRTPENVVI